MITSAFIIFIHSLSRIQKSVIHLREPLKKIRWFNHIELSELPSEPLDSFVSFLGPFDLLLPYLSVNVLLYASLYLSVHATP